MRIAVWNTAFLGDAVLTLPLIRAVREAWPQAGLDFYVRQGLGALFAAQSTVSAVHEVSRAERSPGGMWRLSRRIVRERYHIWIGAHGSHRSSLFAVLSGAPVRVGYDGSWHRRLAYTHMVDRAFGRLDEVERLLELLRPLHVLRAGKADAMTPAGWAGAAWPPVWPDIWPSIELPQTALDDAAAFWATLPDRPVLGMHPGSVWGTKRWTEEGFAAVARQAVEAGVTLVLFAGPGEERMAEAVLARSGLDAAHPQVHNMAGRLDLPRLAAWLRRLDCYLTNDSGPMHLAWMQHVPVVALFGPTVRELGFYPRGVAEVVELPPGELACRPCGLHGPQACPRGDHACMTRITPERVWAALRPHLHERASGRHI